MATKNFTNDKPCDTPRTHNAPVLGDGQHKPTGLKEHALQDYVKRLIVNTEQPHDGRR